jgi:hypothetical protein
MPDARSDLLRNLLLLPLLLGLTACVTYYYPPVDSSDGVYYAADDPGYVSDSGYYATVGYYPWWSLDYFYLGYGYRHSGWSIGVSYGYPAYRWAFRPYAYPAWYYDPWYYAYWYAPVHYHHSWYRYAHHNPYWHARYRGYYGGHHRGHNRGHHPGHRPGHDGRGRYAGGDDHRGDHRHEPGQPPRNPRERGRRVPDGGSYAGTGVPTRRVSVAPARGAVDRGMVIRQRDGNKWSRSRLEPVERSAPVVVHQEPPRVTVRDVVPSRAPQRYVDVNRGGTSLRYPADGKRHGPRTGPVVINEPGPTAVVRDRGGSADPVRSYRLPDNDVVVRAPASAKIPVSRLQPVGPRSAPARNPTPVRSAPPPRSAPVVSAPPRASAPARNPTPVRSAPPPRSAPVVSAPPRASARSAPSRSSQRSAKPARRARTDERR